MKQLNSFSPHNLHFINNWKMWAWLVQVGWWVRMVTHANSKIYVINWLYHIIKSWCCRPFYLRCNLWSRG